MGILNFSDVFLDKEKNPGKTLEKFMKEKKEIVVMIDASPIIYAALKGTSKIHTLTDKNGIPTIHISVLYSNILKYYGLGIRQIWVLDSNSKEKFYKKTEMNKRKQEKEKNKKKMEQLKKEKEYLENLKDELFSDSDEENKDSDDKGTDKSEKILSLNKEIDKFEKRIYGMNDSHVFDLICLLNWFNIPWIEAPPGYEAEQICSMCTYDKSILGFTADYVMSPDSDPIPFGARHLIKQNKRDKKYYEFNLQQILEDFKITMDDLIKICVILGCDIGSHGDINSKLETTKTKGIGPKTVLKKYKTVELSEEYQKPAFERFKKKLTDEESKYLEKNNMKYVQFDDEETLSSVQKYDKATSLFNSNEKFDEFIKWIVEERSFNKDRILKRFKTIKLFTDHIKSTYGS